MTPTDTTTTYSTSAGDPVILEDAHDDIVSDFLAAMRAAGRQAVVVTGRPEEGESLSSFACPCSAELSNGHIRRLSHWAQKHLANNQAIPSNE